MGYDPVVESPSDVPISRVVSVCPPAVVAGIGGERAEAVGEAGVDDFIEIGPFFIGESGVSPIRRRICQIDLRVGDIEIAAENDWL